MIKMMQLENPPYVSHFELMPKNDHYNYHDHCMRIPSENHVELPEQDRQEDHERNNDTSLGFSVDNILRPDFGQSAVLDQFTRKQAYENSINAKCRLSFYSHKDSTIFPHDIEFRGMIFGPPFLNQFAQSASYPVQKEKTHISPTYTITPRNGLSRSGSLESLASNRSSVTCSSVTGSTSLFNAASANNTDTDRKSDSTSSTSTSSTITSSSNSSENQQTSNRSVWPAWVYCTRYSDRPSSGK